MNELMSTVDIGGPLHCLIDAYVPESSLPSLNENASSDLKEFYHEATMLTCDDVVDMQFNSAVSSADKTDYIVAAASGVITATLDLILSDQFSLTSASDWGYERTSSFVVKTAQHLGYSGDELAGAIRFLEERFPLPSDKIMNALGGGTLHHLRDFAHHPSLAGLVFSLLTQFTGMGFGIDSEGQFCVCTLPANAILGQNFVDKLFNGVVVWAFHLISDMAGSSLKPGKGTGIPGLLLSLMEEMSAIPLFRELSLKYKDDRIGYSQWITKLFDGSLLVGNDCETHIRFDLRTEIGVIHELSRQALPVILNECIVRGFYAIRRFVMELQNKKVTTLKKLSEIDYNNILPWNNRIIKRMLTVSSGVFVSIIASGAAIKSLVKNRGVHGAFVHDFLIGLNYIGIGRFVVACVSDSKYLVEDIHRLYDTFVERYRDKVPRSLVGLQSMCLTEVQSRILLELKHHKVCLDILGTKPLKTRTMKESWTMEWGRLCSPTTENIAFRSDMDVLDDLSDKVMEQYQSDPDPAWLYLIALELMLFVPYHPLQSERDKEYRALRYRGEYERTCFSKLQPVVSTDELIVLQKNYKHYLSVLTNRTLKTLSTVAVAATTAVVTGGLAGVLAPKIAVLLAGKSFASLYGAALTKASLALIGGGSIVSGGMGIAGGTAIIAGGGAILGLASTGTVVVSSIALWSSKTYTLNECGKLLTFCKCVLVDKLHRVDLVESILTNVSECAKGLREELDCVAKGIAEAQKKSIAECKMSLKYLEKTKKELQKMICAS